MSEVTSIDLESLDPAGFIRLAPGRTDFEIAADLRRRAVAAQQAVCEVLNDARAAGFCMNMSCTLDPHTGKFICGDQQIIITKHF